MSLKSLLAPSAILLALSQAIPLPASQAAGSDPSVLPLPPTLDFQLYPPADSKTFDLTQALTAHLTYRGQDRVQPYLDAIFKHFDLDMGALDWPKLNFASEAPIDINDLARNFVENERSILDMHQIMSDWLTGFPIKNPWPHVDLTNTKLRSNDLSIQLHYSPELTRRYAKNPGEVVISARFTYRNLSVTTDQVSIFDTNNRFLGDYGATQVAFSSRKGDQPTVFELAILARQSGGGKPGQPGDFRLIGLTSNNNLSRLSPAFGFGDLQMPKIEFIAGNERVPLDTTQVRKEIIARKPDLLKSLLSFMDQEADAYLPGVFTDLFNETFPSGVTFHPTLAIPNAPKGPFGIVDPYAIFGLRPNLLAVTENGLKIGLAGFLNDPELDGDINLKPMPPKFDAEPGSLDPREYDLALAFDTTIVSRLLHFSKRRGGLTEVPSDEGVKPIVGVPKIIGPGSQPDRVKIGLTVSKETAWDTEMLALVSPFQIDLVIELGLEPNPYDDGFDIFVDHIDLDESSIPDHFLRDPHFKSTVKSGLRKNLAKVNEGFRRNRSTPVENVMPLGVIPGFPYQVVQAEYDPNGFLMMYLEFMPPGIKTRGGR